jgi:Amt family ammonium transporter
VVSLKAKLGYDDCLDVFGIHGVAGIVGAVGTGVVAAPALGGFGVVEDIGAQVLVQAQAVLVCIAWTAAVSFAALALVRATIGLRVTESEEREGLDLSSHGERAYDTAPQNAGHMPAYGPV